MPLIAIWGERERNGEVTFSISINGKRLGDVLADYVPRDGIWYQEQHYVSWEQLASITQSSLIHTVEETGALPSEICAKIQDPV